MENDELKSLEIQDQIEAVCEIAVEAGRKILGIYGSDDFQISAKSDSSPLTLADRVSHETITLKLEKNFPGIPVLSEEGADIPFEKRRAWKRFWVVDPLDGTKEFIKRNGEFTVNIALVDEGVPKLGVIFAPVPGTLYRGESRGAFRRQGKGPWESISVSSLSSDVIAVRSRSHASPEEDTYAQRVKCRNIVSAGSSLKFCRIAEGQAHYYFRQGPTMEWDTAAGHAIARAAGAIVTGLNYNKEDLHNGPFLVRCSETLPDFK